MTPTAYWMLPLRQVFLRSRGQLLTGWRNAPQLWVDYDRWTDSERPWAVKDGADRDRVRGRFRWLAAATTYAESLAASMPGATVERFEPMP